GANDQGGPAAAWNGTDWLVVWEDSRGSVPNIYGTRIDTTGTVLDTSGIQMPSQAGGEGEAHVTADGTNWLVVWYSFGSGVLSAARVSPGGVVLDTTPINLGGSGAGGEPIGVAYGAGTYAITYYSSSGPQLQRLSTSGVSLGSITVGAGT